MLAGCSIDSIRNSTGRHSWRFEWDQRLRADRAQLFRAHLQRGGDFEIVAANDLADVETMAVPAQARLRLGTLGRDVAAGDGSITVGSQELKLLTERDPGSLPWSDLGVDVVIESTASSPTATAPRSTSTAARRR
jgi:glyceraldehyde 3-phosphate dehydrogenase